MFANEFKDACASEELDVLKVKQYKYNHHNANMEAPYTKEELLAMTTKEFLELPEKCPRLYPYCLIGLHIDVVRSRMHDWCKNIGNKAEILNSGQGCLMDINTTYYYCEQDENNIMTDVYEAYTF
jgi:hypothetical protein